MNSVSQIFAGLSIVLIATLLGLFSKFRDIPVAPVGAFLRVLLVGAVTRFAQNRTSESDRSQELRLAALDKRLEARQQACAFPRWTCLIAATLVLAACGGANTVDEPDPVTPISVLSTDAALRPTTTAPEGVPAPELAGTSWRVTDYSQGTGIITNVWLTEVTIAFAGDGTVSGSGGCNEYQGTWEAEGTYDEFEEGVSDANDGQVMTLTDLIWTEVACEDERIMEQQEEFIALLQQAGRWVIRYGNFNLRSLDGNFLFEAEPAG